MTASLSATPDKIPSGGTTDICIAGATPNSSILIKCSGSGGNESFNIQTDASGNGCANFTAPSGWTGGFVVEGGDAPPITVTIGS